VIVLMLSLYFAKSTLHRLRLLISNISEFSKGNCALVKVGGNDELAEIDKAFQDMAKARIEAAETQKSMYQMISHDLRSPLTAISFALGFIQDAADEILPQALKDRLARVSSESNRLSRLASSFLDLEELDTGTLNLNVRSIEARMVIDEVAALRAMADSKGLEIEVDIEETLIRVDSDRLVQVIVNLLSNAVKYSSANTRIRVKGITENDHYRLSVCNHGKSISVEEQQKLFQRFARLEGTSAPGSGLGLYICKMILEAHGGSISVSSEDGETCFWIWLPIDAQEPAISVTT
jgi:signal transduction histidine kinase